MGKARVAASDIFRTTGLCNCASAPNPSLILPGGGLVIQGRPLFDEQVKAWKQGPVVPEVYREHAGCRDVSPAIVNGDPQSFFE